MFAEICVKSHFPFHLADGHSGFVSLVIFCSICQYFFMLTYVCVIDLVVYIRIYQVCWYEAVI